MKIEPVASIVPCYTPSGKRVAINTRHQGLPIGTVLYTESQLRQLVEACAAKVETLEIPKVVHGAHPDYIEGKAMQCVIAAYAIRDIIKEMLG